MHLPLEWELLTIVFAWRARSSGISDAPPALAAAAGFSGQDLFSQPSPLEVGLTFIKFPQRVTNE
eukprot:4649814-Amphidinium_carterae.4